MALYHVVTSLTVTVKAECPLFEFEVQPLCFTLLVCVSALDALSATGVNVEVHQTETKMSCRPTLRVGTATWTTHYKCD